MYDENKAKRAITFINALKHTKGKWRGVPFELLPWQDKIMNDVFGTVKENGYRQTANGVRKFTAVQVTVSRQA